MRPLIVEVPSPLGLRPTGVERAPEALRAAGLHARLGCDDAQHVAVPAYDDRRDAATGVLNPGGRSPRWALPSPPAAAPGRSPTWTVSHRWCGPRTSCSPVTGSSTTTTGSAPSTS